MNFSGALFGGIAAVAVTTFVQNKLPVVAFMDARSFVLSEDHITAHIYGRKIRECEFVPKSAVGWAFANGAWSEVSGLEFIDDLSPDNTRPATTDKQDFGLWRWYEPPSDATHLMATVQHNCGGSFELTKVGPFTIEETDQ